MPEHARRVRRVAPRHRARRTAPGAFDALQWALTNDLDRIGPGRAQYTHLLDPDDAHVVDDIIVWWVGAERFVVMPNASNTDRLSPPRVEAARRRRPRSTVDDVTATRAVLAVQGPEARALLAPVAPEAAAVGRFACDVRVAWATCDSSPGPGYTGEDGVEIHVPAAAARRRCGTRSSRPASCPPGSARATRCGSRPGCRCTATSSGAGITPLQAGLGWVVRWDKGDFRGRDAARGRTRAGSRAPAARASSIEGRRPPREGARCCVDGADVGSVTSGNFSPMLGHGIALAFATARRRDRRAPCSSTCAASCSTAVVKLPFVER